MANPQIHHHHPAHLKWQHHHPHLHLHLCHSLTLWQMALLQPKVQLRWHQTHLHPQASCLHPQGRTDLRCLPSLNQSCEYLSCPHVSVPRGQASHQWGLVGGRETGRPVWGLVEMIVSQLCERVKGGIPGYFRTKAFPCLYVGVNVASCLPGRVCQLLPVCGCKQICVAFAGWLLLCMSDPGLHAQPRTEPLCFSSWAPFCELYRDQIGCHCY